MNISNLFTKSQNGNIPKVETIDNAEDYKE